MTSKAKIGIEERWVKEQETERFYRRVLVKWLKGYSIGDIAYSEGGITNAVVMQAISIKRKELIEVQNADIEELAAERIAGLKVIKKEAFDYIEYFPEKVAQLLTVALRAEETEARIQGVLNEKVMHLGRIEHTVKLYDFEDKTPGSIIIDAIVPKPSFVLQEPELPKIEEVVPIDESRMEVIPDLKETPAVTKLKEKILASKPTIVNSVVIIRSGDEILL